MPVRLLNSSVLKWPDLRTVDRAIRRWAAETGHKRPEVQRIGYFGSYARGNGGVGSDLDLLIIVKSSDKAFERRGLDWDVTEFPVPVDVVIYTKDEWESLRKQMHFCSTLAREVVWVYTIDGERHDIEHRDAKDTAHFLQERRLAYVDLLKASVIRLVDALSALEEVQKVSLFGSYPRGRVDLFTDLDVLVIMKTDMSFPDRLQMLYSRLALPVDLDLLCYTPEEWENLKTRPFFRHALQDEKVVYERKRS